MMMEAICSSKKVSIRLQHCTTRPQLVFSLFNDTVQVAMLDGADVSVKTITTGK
jgi:hypothetical protein